MKKLSLVIIGAGILAGLGFYVNRPKAQPFPAAEMVTESESAPSTEEPQPLESVAPPPESPRQALPLPGISVSTTIARTPAAAVNPALDASFLGKTIELLVSPQVSYSDKRAAWKQLREAGKLDQAIAELEQRTANEPRAAEYPAALGQAYLQKCATSQDLREQGILAMQADKVFESALNLDPSNWEARFTKAVAMSYWPPMLNKGEEIIQNFQTLIQQQETQSPQPHFADSYLWLGEQYQKAGHTEEARSTWQRGATLFPDHEKLRSKLGSAP